MFDVKYGFQKVIRVSASIEAGVTCVEVMACALPVVGVAASIHHGLVGDGFSLNLHILGLDIVVGYIKPPKRVYTAYNFDLMPTGFAENLSAGTFDDMFEISDELKAKIKADFGRVEAEQKAI